jgi:hypothetical protein
MENKDSHIRQWKHNREFLVAIPPEYPDWIVTVTFYVALHAVDSLLSHDNVTRVTSHDTRNEVLIHTKRYDGIKGRFLTLYDLSRTVRYLADPAKWVPISQVQKNVIARYLYPIEKSVQTLMGQDLRLPKIEIQTASAATPHNPARAPVQPQVPETPK